MKIIIIIISILFIKNCLIAQNEYYSEVLYINQNSTYESYTFVDKYIQNDTLVTISRYQKTKGLFRKIETDSLVINKFGIILNNEYFFCYDSIHYKDISNNLMIINPSAIAQDYFVNNKEYKINVYEVKNEELRNSSAECPYSRFYIDIKNSRVFRIDWFTELNINNQKIEMTCAFEFLLDNQSSINHKDLQLLDQ